MEGDVRRVSGVVACYAGYGISVGVRDRQARRFVLRSTADPAERTPARRLDLLMGAQWQLLREQAAWCCRQGSLARRCTAADAGMLLAGRLGPRCRAGDGSGAARGGSLAAQETGDRGRPGRC